MMKKFLCLAALVFALSAAGAAQRVGPVEEEPSTASNGTAAKNEKRTDAAKPDAKPAEKSATKDSKGEARTAPSPAGDKSAPTPSENKPAPQASAASLNTTPAAQGERTANPAAGDAAAAGPQATQSQMPVFGSPSIGSLPTPPKYEPPPPVKAEIPAASAAPNNAAPTAPAVPPTSIYRVGVGDILDIRLVGGMSREGTLYTVLTNGTIDYPLAGEPLQAASLTTDELGARLSAALKRRGIFDRAQFQINVREYVSHTVLVSGLVDQPGQKVLRREAVPLYVVLAEAFPRADAGRVVIISRQTGLTKTLDLSDSNALNELVASGDVINVQPRPREFFYIGGQVGSAGQKDYNTGMTLTQAILAAGGLTREAGARVRVAVARQGADGRLVTAEYDLREIESGKIPDPRIQAGDRIEVGRRR